MARTSLGLRIPGAGPPSCWLRWRTMATAERSRTRVSGTLTVMEASDRTAAKASYTDSVGTATMMLEKVPTPKSPTRRACSRAAHRASSPRRRPRRQFLSFDDARGWAYISGTSTIPPEKTPHPMAVALGRGCEARHPSPVSTGILTSARWKHLRMCVAGVASHVATEKARSRVESGGP